MPRRAQIIQDPENEVPVEILAASIVQIGAAMTLIANSRLNQEALVILIADDTRLPKYKIKAVLDSLSSIEQLYLRPRSSHGTESTY